jgi:hypothetical protein
MLTKRITILLVLLLTAVVTACGDDGGEECVGHLCGEPAAITDPDGGNILFEYIYFDTELSAAFMLPAGVTTANRVMAYFTNRQTPDNNTLPTPGVCNNLTKGWPMFQGESHEDLDVGALSITGKNKAGTDVTISLEKKTAAIDSIGRPHDLFYQIISPDADKFLLPDSSYTVNLGGSDKVAATSFKDALFLAKDFTITMPQVEGNGPMKANADFTVKWNPVQSANLPAGAEVLGVTWLVDSKGAPTHMCPVAHSAGTFTIPAATIAEYRTIAASRGAEPNKVILLRNAIVHRLQPLPVNEATNKRRVDMLTVMCWAQLMDCAAN